MSNNWESLSSYAMLHHLQNEAILRSIAKPSFRNRFPKRTLIELRDRSAIKLYGINCRARIAFADAMGRAMVQCLENGEVDPVFFVSLCPREFVTPLSQAADFDVEDLVVWTRRRLKGFAYFGCVEAAFYVDPAAVAGSKEPVVAWHTHAIILGDDPRAIRRRMEKIEATARPFLPGAFAAHAQRLRPEAIPVLTRYMLKGPWIRYKMYPVKVPLKSTEFPLKGEGAAVEPTGAWRQQKEPMVKRPGEALKMAQALAGLTLYDLTFAAGIGMEIRRNGLHEAVRTISREDIVRRQFLEDLLDPKPKRSFDRLSGRFRFQNA